METQTVTPKTYAHEIVPLKEKISFALTNTGQTMIYALFTTYLMMYMTDYLIIAPGVAGLIISLTRIFDAINDPIMGQIVDRTKSKWGKCRPYMLFTPVPLLIVTMLMFAPFKFSNAGAIAYVSIIYIIFTMVYTANDIPYWSMSSVITTDPKQRVSLVSMTRIIGGMGSALCIGTFWTVNKLFADAGVNAADDPTKGRMSFFLAAMVFAVVGCILLLQGFFNTKERAVDTNTKKESFFTNLKLIPKSKPLVLNLIAGALLSIMAVGMTALTTYFVKWNIKEVFPNMESNLIMSVFTPVIGILPAIASVVGILSVPMLTKRFEKKNILITFAIIGAVFNVISYFAGYSNIYVFIILRFFAFLPVGVWSGITTLMFGDAVDHIEYNTGKRVEGTCFSLLTFVGKFQNSINVALTGLILSIVGYDGKLDPDVAQQSPEALHGIFIMVTLVAALGCLLMMIPFFFYDFDKKTHEMMVDELLRRRNSRLEEEKNNGTPAV